MNNEISYNDVALFENIKEADLDKLLVCIRSFKKEFKKGQTIYMETDNIPYVGIVSCPNACGFHAQIATNLFHLLGTKNQKFLNKIEVLSKGSIREKLLAYISQLAQEQNIKYVNSPLSRVALAEYLSVNRSAMIRELSKMRDDGIIDFDKDTFIVKEINKSKVPSLP